ncbi:MAG TPA: DUF4153 domain-containing protein [Sphingomicrobium sp.]|jgi:hypothetical protein
MDMLEADEGRWPVRPWILAGICALAGLIFEWLTDFPYSARPQPLREAAATFVAIAALSFALTVELRRWTWAAAFALVWGLVIAFVGWFTASYNHQAEIFEWPFLAGVFAVLIAAPLFQTVRDEGAWRFPYERLHRHAWLDAVIGAASLAFTGVAFILAFLIASLFDLIGIRFIKDLLNESWFCWILGGTAFGAALGLLRERDSLLATLHRLIMIVFSVMAPVLAVALGVFLLSFPLTGFNPRSPFADATPILLALAAAAVVLTNAVIGDGKAERSPNRLLQISAMVLIVTVLPLGLLAAYSMGQRIEQYGWTPERMWGVVAVGVTIAYGLAGLWSVVRKRRDFDDTLRPLQTMLAIALCGLALFLALPIVDFGAISARSQLARLEQGKIPSDKFDWTAMAFDFGPAGRRRLADIARSGPLEQRKSAAAALNTKTRWEVTETVQAVASAPTIAKNLRVVPAGMQVPEGLRSAVERSRFCREAPCVLTIVDRDRAILFGRNGANDAVGSVHIERANDGTWPEHDDFPIFAGSEAQKVNLAGEVQVRTVQRRQLFVDGKPVGDAFE